MWIRREQKLPQVLTFWAKESLAKQLAPARAHSPNSGIGGGCSHAVEHSRIADQPRNSGDSGGNAGLRLVFWIGTIRFDQIMQIWRAGRPMPGSRSCANMRPGSEGVEPAPADKHSY